MKTAAETDKQRWARETLAPALEQSPERAASFTTISGRPIERLYTAEDRAGIDDARDLNDPGNFPYTRGIHATGYRGKLWTMRQFAGFGTPEETNRRYRALLKAGGTGLSVAFDLPTLMGRDPDHELSLGEVGKCGVSVMSLADMEMLFDGIALGGITSSMTINSPAAMIFAMYLVVAEQQGVAWDALSGTIQNDILKEFIAQKEYIFPPRPSMRIITAGELIVIDVVMSPSRMPSNSVSMSASEVTLTPHFPTSPSDSAWSGSRPISVGRSNATLRPVPPAAIRSL